MLFSFDVWNFFTPVEEDRLHKQRWKQSVSSCLALYSAPWWISDHYHFCTTFPYFIDYSWPFAPNIIGWIISIFIPEYKNPVLLLKPVITRCKSLGVNQMKINIEQIWKKYEIWKMWRKYLQMQGCTICKNVMF